MTNSFSIIFVIVNFIIFFLVAKISHNLNLLDKPNKRKLHLTPTPFTGGVAISICYVFSIYLFNININELNLVLSFALLISIVGLIDDKYDLNIGGKLSLQIIPIIYLIVSENLTLNNLGNYNYFELKLNSFSIPFTLISILLLINSYNYFDGMDGTLSIMSLTVFLILYFLTDDENIKLFLITLSMTGIIFLFFNFSVFKLPKLFAGDSGSLMIGFVTAFVLIYLSNEDLVHPILLAFSISIFVYEFLSINLIRYMNKKNIFTAGRDHLHHIILYKTNSVILTNLFISSMNIIFFIIGYLILKFLNEFCALLVFILLFIAYLIIRKKFSKYN